MPLVFLFNSLFAIAPLPNSHLIEYYPIDKECHTEGEILDYLDDIPIYNNGKMQNTFGRHLSEDGYNFGLKWQCVEFVKRYYYFHFDHKMPNTYGHAKDFFDKNLGTGWNADRGLFQQSNNSRNLPEKGSILVFAPTKNRSLNKSRLFTNKFFLFD